MINHYIIDGNNLIGKIPSLWKLQQKDPQSSREKLAFKLDSYFASKRVKVTLHFDGHPGTAIKVSHLKIEYSENKKADEMIKFEIGIVKNPKLVCVITSDHNLIEFARVSRCKVQRSEEFRNEIESNKEKEDEDQIINSIDDDEIKRIFGVD